MRACLDIALIREWLVTLAAPDNFAFIFDAFLRRYPFHGVLLIAQCSATNIAFIREGGVRLTTFAAFLDQVRSRVDHEQVLAIPAAREIAEIHGVAYRALLFI